jgi:hypothetical protein
MSVGSRKGLENATFIPLLHNKIAKSMLMRLGVGI